MSWWRRSKSIAPKPHLVFLQYYFPPMGGGGVQRITKFLKYLDHQRFQVTVVTVRPSYFYTSDPTLAAEIPPEVRVIRSGSLDPFRLIYLFKHFWRRRRPSREEASPRESSGRVRKIAMSLFVPDSRLLWLPFALLKLWRLHRRQRIDVLVASMPPFTTGLIGRIARRILGVPLVLDFRDAWSENPYLPRVGRLQERLNRRLEAGCLRSADALLFVNPALEAHYLRRFPSISGRPHHTIRNGYDPEDFAGINLQPPDGSRFELGILGTVYSQGNRPTALLRALQQRYAREPDLPSRFRLSFVGKWSPDFLTLVNEMGIDPLLQFIPYRPHREALALAARFDALALAIDGDLPGSAEVTPGRIYEYLYLRKPVLALCPKNSDLACLVRDNRAGEVLASDDVDGIERVLADWMTSRSLLSQRYGNANLEIYSRPRQTEALMEFLEWVIGAGDASKG